MNWIHRLQQRIKVLFSGFFATLGFISTLVTILTAIGLGSAFVGFLSHLLLLIVIGGSVVVLSLLIFAVLYTFEEKAKGIKPVLTDTIQYPSPHDDEAVEILLKEIVYEYLPDGQTILQRKRLHLRALRNGIRHFTDRYRWTGSGKCVVSSLTPGCTISNQHKEDVWDYFDVIFPRSLHKGEEIDFTIEWELFDKEKTAVPFLGTLIDRETKHLLLQVILPRELVPTRAYCHEFANNVDTLPTETRPAQWSPATRGIIYNVPHPRKYHKYAIRWYYD